MFDLALGLPPAERYSYIFEGASQDLDHVLVNAALRDIASLDIVHLNAEFPLAERASDHDPLLLRLAFAAPVPEPSSLALMLVPAILAAARRPRRHSNSGTERATPGFPDRLMSECRGGSGRVARPCGFALTDPGMRLSRTRLFPEVTRIGTLVVPRE